MLIEEAERLRKAERITIARLAAEMEVSPALWSLTKSGRKPLDRKLTRAIIKRWPDLRPLATIEGAKHLLGE